MAEARADNFCA